MNQNNEHAVNSCENNVLIHFCRQLVGPDSWMRMWNKGTLCFYYIPRELIDIEKDILADDFKKLTKMKLIGYGA